MAKVGQWPPRKTKTSGPISEGSAEARPRPSGAMALERRIAFDAAITETVHATSGAGDVAAAPAADHDPVALGDKLVAPPVAAESLDRQAPTTIDSRPASDWATNRTEIIFIDSRVSDVATLIRGLNNPGAEVVLLDVNRDGVQQIAEVLAGRTRVDAIHLLSHGSEGDLLLGSSHLTAETIAGQYGDVLAKIGQSLSQDADILIYGCDFGKGGEGKLAAELLAAKTGADVAASDDITGSAQLGGDWELETRFGRLETSIVINDWAQTEWRYSLQAYTVDFASTFGTTNQNLTSTAINATVGGVTVGITGGKSGTFDATTTLRIEPTTAINGVTGNINSTMDASTDNGTSYQEIVVTFSQPVYAVSFSVIDIDGKSLLTSGGSLFNDIITVTGNGALPTAVKTGLNVDYNTITGLTSTRGGSVSNATDGTATYFFGSGITSLTIRHVSGDAVGLTNPGNQGIGITDIAFNTSAPWTTNEDTSVQLSGLTSGSSSSSGSITMNFSAPAGNTLAATAGGGVTVSGSGTTSLTLTGTRVAIDAYLASASAPTFASTANANGLFNVTLTTNDGGPAITDTRAVLVLPVNDMPAGANATVTATEDTAVALTAANFGFTDTIDSHQFLGVVVSTLPTAGTLYLSGVAVTAGQFISQFDVNNGSLTYLPALNASGTGIASFTFQVRDNGGTQFGGADTDSTPNTITFNVTAVNDAPVNTLPASFATETNTSIFLTGLAVTDVDAAGNVTVTLSVPASSGTFALATNVSGGVTSGQVTGNGTRTVTITAPIAAINATLASATGLAYAPNTGSTGSVVLTMTANDGALIDTDTATITITTPDPANNAPVNTLPAAAWTATEDTAFALTGISITDLDIGSGNATVTLSVTAGSLNLSTSVSGGVSSAQISGNGTATVTITAPLSVINTTLSNATGLMFTPAANSTTNVTFTIDTNDNGGTGTGGAKSDNDTKVIAITAVNDAPVLSTPSSQTFTENGSALAISPSLVLTDIDSTVMTTATVSITNFVFGQDVLAFTNVPATMGNIAGGFNSLTGILTLSSAGNTATLAQWQTALRAVTYRNTSDAPDTTTRNIAFAITETGTPNSVSNILTSTMLIAAVNDAPVVAIPIPDQSVNEDTAWSYVVPLGSFTDVDSTLTWSATLDTGAALPSWLSFNAATRTFSGTPPLNFNGAIGLRVTVTDGVASPVSDDFALTVNPVNDAPVVAIPIPDQSVNEDTAWSYVVPLGSFTDVDSTLTWSATLDTGAALPSWLTFNASTRTFSGTPPLNFNGAIGLRVTVTDGVASPVSDDFVLTVTPVNDAPVNSVPGAQTIAEDTTRVFSVANGNAITVSDIDIGSGNFTTVVSVPAGHKLTAVTGGGAVIAGNGSNSVSITGTKAQVDAALNGLSYAPPANYNGSISLQVQTSDNGGTGSGGTLTDTDTIAITVTAVNDAPTISAPASLAGTEDTALTITGVSFADIDISTGGAIITFSVPPGSGVLNWVTTAFIGATGSGTTTLTLTGQLTAINNALLANKLSITPATDLNGTVVLSIGINDNGNNGTGGPLSASTTANLVFASVNDSPAGTNNTTTINEDAPFTFSAADFGFSDASDMPANSLQSVVITTLPPAGQGVLRLSGIAVTAGQEISLANLASLVFTPTANLNGSGLGAFTFQVRDNGGTANGGVNLDPTPNTFQFTITPVNDAPAAVADLATTNEDTPVTIDVRTNDSDVDGDALAVSAINGAAISVGSPVTVTHGTVALLADGRLTFTPAADYNGPASFNYTVRDPSGATSTALVSLTITAVNDAPVSLTPIANQSGLDGGSVNLNVAGNFSDVDGDALTYSATGLPAGLSINASTGLISGTIDKNASVTGTYTVFVEARDPSSATVTRSFTFTVTNPAPTPANDAFTAAEDTGITGNLLANNGSGADTDPDGDALTVGTVPVTPPAHGVVSIAADGSFTYTPDANYYGSDSFVYSVTDANGATTTATVSITVTPVNDAPTPPASLPAQTSNDGQTIAPVNLAAGWSDIEGNAMTFTATGLPPGLNIAADGTVTGTLASNASTGDGSNDGVRTYSVTLTATDSDGGVTSRVFTWTVNNLPPDARDDVAATGETTPVTGFNVITDAGPGRDVDPDGDTTLSVIAVNGLAGGVGGIVAGSSGGVFTINADGSYSFDPGTDFIDVPAGGTRTTSIQYTISDGEGGTDSATLTVTVTGNNQAPVATPIGDKANLDGATVATSVASFFSDIDADALTFAISGGLLPPGLTLNPATGQISGMINNQASQGGNVPGQPGVYSVTIRATDTSGATASTTFKWSVTNPAPTAVNDGPLSWVEDSGTLANIDVLGNDTDPDSDPLAVISAIAAKGTVTINGDGTLNYTPNANYNGTDTIIYQISDGNGGVSTASVTIVVADDFADPPILIDPNTLPTLNNQDREAVSLPVNGFFVRGDNPIASFTINGQLPPGITFNSMTGTLAGALDANASASAWPPGNTPGVYELSITATDSGGLSVTQNIRWEVTNPAPTANADTASVNENGTIAIDVLANDTDPDGGPSNNNAADSDDLVVSAAAAGHGMVAINADGTIQYTPDADFNGTDTITYTLSDGNGGFSTASVAVTVNPVNDAPEFADGVTGLPSRASTDSSLIAVDLAPFFKDKDLDPGIVQTPQGDVLAYSLSSGSLPPGLTLAADGKITGTITSGASGPTGTQIYTAQITVSDGKGGSFTTAFAWTVTNPPPVAVDNSFSGPEDTTIYVPLSGAGSLTANDNDTDSDAFAVRIVNGTPIRDGLGNLIDGLSIATAHGAFTVDAANDRLVYQPDANYHGADSATYVICDANGGTATASINLNIISVNDVPVAANDTATTDEDTPVSIDVIKAAGAPGAPGQDTDADGDTLTITSASVPPAQGTVSIVGNQLLFTPAADFNGAATISYTISDGNGGVSTANVIVTVNAINDAPVAANDTAATAEDTAITINPRVNDSDVDGDSFTVSQIDGQPVAVGAPVTVSHGMVVLNVAGNLVFKPDPDYNGPASFTYTVLDSNGATSAPATVSLTVTSINDAPVAQDDVLATTENTGLSGNVLANNGSGPDSDVDGDALTVSAVNGDALKVGQAVTGSAGGSFIINATGGYSFNPGAAFDDLAPGETRVTSVQYTVSDGNGGISTATVSVTVTGQNDAPIIVDPGTGLPSATPGSAVPTQNLTDAQPSTPLNISGYFRDPDASQALTLSIPGGLLPTGISFNAATGTFSGTPAADASQGNTPGQPAGIYVIPVTATDPSGVTVTTNVRFVIANPAPIAGDDNATTAEDTAAVGSVTGNDSDPDGDPLTYSVVSGPAHGVLILAADGTYTYTPDANYNGSDSFTYQVSDGQGGVAVATVNLTITPVNDAPVVTAPTAQTIAEDQPLTFSAANGNALSVTDADPGATLVTTLSVGTGVLNIASFAGLSVIGNGSGFVTLSGLAADINAALEGLVYTPLADVPGNVTLTIASNDGAVTTSASVAMTINPVADIVADTASTNEDTPVVLNLLANDSFENPGRAITAIDGSPLVIGTPVAVTNGSVALNADGTVTFTPSANYHGPASFAYTVTSNGVTETAAVSLTVNIVNDVPVAGNDSATTNEDTPVDITVLGNDTDADGDPLVIVASGPQAPSASNGAVTVNPDGTLHYVPPANFHGADTITYTVSDGNGGFATATVSVTVNSVNDVPVAQNDSVATNEDTAVTIAVRGNDSDADGEAVTVNTVDGQAIAVGSPVAVANGTVSLTAGGDLIFTPAANFHGPASFTYTVQDPNGALSAPATVSVTVNAVNDAPTAGNDSASTNEDTPVDITVLANDTDVDGDLLTIVASGPQAPSAPNGTVTVNPDGTLHYVPNLNYHGADTITYTVSDGNGGFAMATVAVTVVSVNDAPTTGDETAATNEDTPVGIAVLANDSDADGDPLAIVSSGPQAPAALNGTVTINPDGTLRYVPNPNFHGSDTITYTVSDGNGGLATATVSVTVNSVNDVPVANNDSATTNEDTAATIVVLTNDSDADGDPLTIVSSGPQAPAALNGTVTVNPDGSLRYVPNPNFHGADVITYTVIDGNGGFSAATVSVTVNSVNDAPVANNDSATTNEDTAATIAVLANDSDADGDPLTIVSSGPQAPAALNGTVTVNPDGTLRYVPNPNFHGADTITYTVSDGNGGLATATVSVTVNSVNDVPAANNDSATTNEDTAAIIVVLANDSDADGDPLTIVSSGPQAPAALNGTVTINPDGTLRYVPNPNFHGADTITYTVSDGNGGFTSATVSVTVNPVNDTPMANSDSAATAEDTPVTISVLANDSDVDGDALTVTSATAGNGIVVVNPDGTVTYTPDLNFFGSDTITYQISDGHGGSATSTVTVTVSPVNDPPIVGPAGDRNNTDGQGAAVNLGPTFTDPEGQALVFSASNLPAGLSIDPATGLITGSIAASASQGGNVPGQPGVYSVTVTATDPQGAASTVTFTWAITNLMPVAVSDVASTNEDAGVTVAPLVNDHDPDGDAIAIVSAAAGHGSVVINPDGTVRYQPNPDFFGSDTIVYTIRDADGFQSTAQITVTVDPVNDLPVAIDPLPNRNGLDGQSPAVTFGPLFSDPEGGPLTFAATGLPGGLGIDPATGAITGSIAASASTVNGGVYTVTLTATDSDGGAITRTFTWTVTNVGPAAGPDTATTAEEQPVTITVLANDIDDDGDPLTVVAASVDPLQGSVVINGDGTLTFTPAVDFNGLAMITYTIADDGGLRSTSSVAVTVTPVNDAPVIAPLPSVSTADGAPLSFDLSSFFSDVDAGQTLTVSYAGLPPGLTFASDGAISGTVAHDASQGGSAGVYSVAATVSDGNGGVTTRSFTVVVRNVAPVAADDSAVTDEDTPVTVDLLKLTTASGTPGKDVDPDGDALTIASASASHGSVTVNPDGTVVYTPAPGFFGADIITYTVSDGEGGLSTASATITVLPVNDPPIAQADVATTNEDQPVTIAVLSNDSDPEGDALAVASASVSPGQGTVSINGDGTLTFTPALDFNGTATITYTVSDGHGGTATSTVTVTVLPQPEAPLPLPDAATTNEDTPVTIDVLANDSDPDGGVLQVTSVTVDPAQGSVVVNPDGTITFTPAPDFNGGAVITYQVTDDTGRVSTSTATVAVSPVNDAPVALPDSGAVASGGSVTFNPLANDGDVDGPMLSISGIDGQPIVVGAAIPVTGGQVTPNLDGTLTFSANPGFIGTAQFSYEVSDGAGGVSTAMIRLSVVAADINPVFPVGQPPLPPSQPSTPLPTGLPDVAVSPPRIVSEGIILETLTRFGGLDSAMPSLGSERPLLDALNGIQQLDNGLELNSAAGRILDPRRFGPFHRELTSNGDASGPQSADPDLSGQMIPMPGGLRGISGERSLVEGRLDGSVLILTFADDIGLSGLWRGASGLSIAVTLADGSPLPSWLTWNGKDQLVGSPPDELDSIDILVRIQNADGATITRTLTVNLRDGAVTPLSTRKTGMDETAPLFSRQLALAVDRGSGAPASGASLADMIRGAS